MSIDMEVSINGDTPKWFVYEGKRMKTPFKWMIWGYPGYPYVRKPPCIENQCVP